MIKIEDIVLDGKPSNDSGRQMPAMTEEEKEILQHHGVIGMHWGKGRKTKVPKQTVNSKPIGVDEAAREKQFRTEYANRDKMSTRALQNRVKRLQAEQQFKELVNKPAAERAKAAQAIAEKKRKRNKMLLRTALGIYGNLPMDSFGKKGKELKEILGPSQAIAKATSSSEVLKNSAIDNETENVLLHYGIKGMRRGIRKQIIAAGGRRDVRLLKRQNIAAIKIYKGNKINYKVAKGNFKANRNRINKQQYKAAKKMYKGAKVAKKAQMQASKIRSQELIEKYLKQNDNSYVLLHKGVDKTLAHGSDYTQEKNMAINKDDVILHYGVRGMHWGTKRGRAISKLASSTEGTGIRKLGVTTVKNIGNAIAHPLVTTGVMAKNASVHPIMSATSPITMLKKDNQDIRATVLKNKHLNKAAKIHKTNVAIAKDNVKLAAAKKKYGKGTKADLKLAKHNLRDAKEDISDYSKVINKSGGVTTSAQYKAKKKELAQFGKNLRKKKAENRKSANKAIAEYKKQAKNKK